MVVYYWRDIGGAQTSCPRCWSRSGMLLCAITAQVCPSEMQRKLIPAHHPTNSDQYLGQKGDFGVVAGFIPRLELIWEDSYHISI